MVLDKLYLPNLRAVRQNTPRKTCAVALITLLCSNSSFLADPLRSLWYLALSTLIELLELPPVEAKEEGDIMDVASKSFSTSAARLVYAKPLEFDPCADVNVADLRGLLATRLVQLGQTQSWVRQECNKMSPDFQNTLGNYLKAAGVSL